MKKIDIIAHSHNISTELLIGISFAESEIGIKFAPKKECKEMNNWGGIKAFKQDTGETLRVKLPYSGCRLYPFESVEQYFEGLANTVALGYVNGGCNDLYCLSSRYVGKPGSPKTSRVQRVAFYINYK